MAEAMEREITYNADHYITRYEMDCRTRYERELSDQRLEIANLKAEKVSNEHDIELYKQFRTDLKEALDPIKDDIKHLQRHAADQDVWNAATKGSIIRLRDDVNDLLRLTRRVVPNESVSPGWGDIP